MCACVSEDGPCYWLRVDYSRGEGVCSCCSERVAEWDAEIGRKSIDDQFIELMDALDGYDSPEAISQRLAELQGPIRELAAACRQTVLFNRAQVEFQSTKTDIELRPMEGVPHAELGEDPASTCRGFSAGGPECLIVSECFEIWSLTLRKRLSAERSFAGGMPAKTERGGRS
eukprot:gene14827-17532_t